MKVLFLGNGINRVSNKYSWENLLDELWSFVNDPNQIARQKKPFPMFYEEIYLLALKNKNLSELVLKLHIIDKIEEKITQGHYHKEIGSLDFSEIITTNYDYNIEKGLSIDLEKATKSLDIFETRYSLFRCKTFET